MANNDLYTQPNSVEFKDLLDRAQRYCSTAEHCPADVEQLLFRYGATREQTNEVIGILVKQNFIDTARYCRAFVHDKVAFQGWGRMKIIMGLRAKRLPDALIDEAISGIDQSTYNANIRKLLQSKRGQDKQKQLRFMLQRGFTIDELHTYAHIEDTDIDYENYD